MKTTQQTLKSYKETGRKIVAVTAYDYPSAKILDDAGVDILLVGDSLGNVVQGKTTTLSVTLEQMIYHGEIVARAAQSAFVVIDIPFPFCQLGPDEAIRAAAKILKETDADAVKIEGGEHRAETIAALVNADIPVMGHCGLLPQGVKKQGGFFVQRDTRQLLRDITTIEKAGAFAIVLECVPTSLAKKATAQTALPTIGIGAGPDCDGQILVFHDLIGFTPKGADSRFPKHAKQYADLRSVITNSVKRYAEEIHSGTFPGQEQSFR